MNFDLKDKGEWSYFHLPELTDVGIRHGFCAGRSPWQLLEENTRNRFLSTFHLKDLVIMDQEHGDAVHTIRDGERPYAGDGLIMMEPRVAGIIKTADCLPVIIADPAFPMASIIHAGWRGTVKGIVGKAVRQMILLGANVEKVTALLGPSIGPCCYEVGQDVHSVFINAGFPREVFREKKGSLYLDLRAANRWLLREEGVERICETDLCTFCAKALFYSYRRGDGDKRQINFVSVDR